MKLLLRAADLFALPKEIDARLLDVLQSTLLDDDDDQPATDQLEGKQKAPVGDRRFSVRFGSASE